MKKIISVFLLTLILTLASCNKKTTAKSNETKTKKTTISTTTEYKFKVNVLDDLPDIMPYTDFDVMTVIEKEEGVTYEFEGVYLDNRMKEKQISFNGSVMNIPQDETVAEITVTAYKGSEIAMKDIAFSVIGKPDVIDYGIANCWHEDSITAIMNYNPAYIKDGDSSIKFTFSGFYVSHGVQFCNITGHLSNNDKVGIYDTQYFSIYQEEDEEEAFKDAYVVFYIYNDMRDQSESGFEDSIDIGFRVKDSDYHGATNIDWATSPIINCKKGEWTLVVLSLKSIGKETNFYKNLEVFYSGSCTSYEFNNSYDALNFKVLGKNCEKDPNTGEFSDEYKYTFNFYFDGLDIMSKAQYEAKFGQQ